MTADIPLVKAHHKDKPTTPIAQILKRHEAVQLDTGAGYTLPFVNTKFKANVRVVDFWPHKLEDFCVGRRATEYDILSDASSGEGTDREEDMRKFREGKGYGGKKKWEWRFALQVEQAGKVKGPEKIWLLVDNMSAQMLFGEDATK
jgi:protection-of-telomeres protein 1